MIGLLIDNKLGVVKELVVALLLLPCQHLSGGTEERHEELRLVVPLVGREIERAAMNTKQESEVPCDYIRITHL